MINIHKCTGKHFKVYDPDQLRVLQHERETETVALEFHLDHEYFIITVKEYEDAQMRVPDQKRRIDLYIMQNQFLPVLSNLRFQIEKLNVVQSPVIPWRFGNPVARGSRLAVPAIIKLCELSNVTTVATFQNHIVTMNDAYCIFDSEVPKKQHTKWTREGGSRQIHIGVFRGRWTKSERREELDVVKIMIPTRYLVNRFLEPVESGWIEG